MFGASLLSILIFFFPTLFGEGYETIKTLSTDHPEILLDNTLLGSFKSNEWIMLFFIGFTLLLKSVATGLTLGSGGNGGNFAPSLFVGSYLGFFVAKFFDLTGINNHLPVTNFTIVGMAGILSGLFHAPLTAIFLIAEITGGYNLMVPLMIVSSISLAVSKRFEKHSMDVKNLAVKGDVFTSDKDQNILSSLDILKLVQTQEKTILPTESVENVVQLFAKNDQYFFPVVDNHKNLIGIIDLHHIKSIIFNSFRVKYTELTEIIIQPKMIVVYDDKASEVLQKMDELECEVLPVIKNGKYFGLIYKIDILESYRKQVKEMVIE